VRRLELRRPDTCAACSRPLAAGTPAWWDSSLRTVTCIDCAGETDVDEAPAATAPVTESGQAGASAEREYQRRHANREGRVRARHPRIGGVLLALSGQPVHERVWARGAAGEVAAAATLERDCDGSPVRFLHDRRMPRTRGNIDHIAIAPSGVWVIDTKRYTGKVEVSTPWFGSPKLKINGRNKTALVGGLAKQHAAVGSSLSGEAPSPPVHGAFCFLDADLPLGLTRLPVPLIGTLTIDGYPCLYPRALAKRLRQTDGPLDITAIHELYTRLGLAFPPA
jgi:Nuclease-related domain